MAVRETFPEASSPTGLILAGIVGVVGVAGSYGTAGPSRAFIVAPVNSLVVDLMPAEVLRFSILVLGEVGDLLGYLLSIALAVAAIGLIALVGFAVGRHRGTLAALATTYFGTLGLTLGLTRAPWAALGVALPATGAVALVALHHIDRVGSVDETRRMAIRLAGAAAFSGLAYEAGNRLFAGAFAREPPRLSVIPADEQAEIEARLASARDQSLDVSGIDGLVSPVGAFYEVDVDAINPDVATDDWRFDVTGDVDHERTYTFDDLTGQAPVHQFATLRCVGEALNADLMDTALWTGVPVLALLEEAGVDEGATHVQLQAVDGYYESVPIEALRDGLLAYGMNGYLLPRNHGYPVRAIVPGHWGEVHVKWIDAIEVTTKSPESYWEARGWHGTGPVNTVAKLHAQNQLPDGRIQVGGHAYAGSRGISRVEVSTDGGTSWDPAELSAPLPDQATWRQWAYTYDPPAGEHEVVVRAIDGTGTTQPRGQHAAFPSGAAGWVSVTVQP